MKQAYFLAALLCCPACDELEEASDDPLPLDASTMDAGGAALDATPAPRDSALDAGETPDASQPDAMSNAADAAVEADASSGADASTLPATDYAMAEAFAARGRECNVIGEGVWSPDYSPGAFCASRCLLGADCDAFRVALCVERVMLPDSLNECFQTCKLEIDVLAGSIAQCGDGVTTVPYRQLCDGTRQCASGVDEQGCVFRCADGEQIFGLGRCNGYDDCADKSDEQGCATLCGMPRW
jgi:hypothetical protein